MTRLPIKILKGKTVLVAPLNWGLGHATRCIPLIRSLIDQGNKVILASDGLALKVLQDNFPTTPFIQLPSYKITYRFKSMLLNGVTLFPKVIKAILQEKKMIDRIVKEHSVECIISDNRYGCYSSLCRSIFITHQLTLQHENKFISNLSTKGHRWLSRHFEEIWVPDFANRSLSGKLSDNSGWTQPITFIGPQSIHYIIGGKNKDIDVLILLSGPEPARSRLCHKIASQLHSLDNYKITIIGGTNKAYTLPVTIQGHTSYIPMVTGAELTEILNRSRLVVSRSGYSTIMDILCTNKEAVLIPTPGQTEQIYLADHIQKRFPSLTSLKEEHISALPDKITTILNEFKI